MRPLSNHVSPPPQTREVNHWAL